jgi:hypothetical protein
MGEKDTGRNLLAWGKALDEVGGSRRDLGYLKESRLTSWDRIEELGLPSHTRTVLPLEVFLRNPASLGKGEKEGELFVLLEPRHEDGKRYRKLGLKKSEVVGYLNQVISDNNLKVEDYDLAISETLLQAYGGNIVVSSDGGVVVELSGGGQGFVADGSHDPNKHGDMMRVWRDPLLGSFKYSWPLKGDKESEEYKEAESLRKAVYQTVLHLPHEGEGRDIKFAPGYYEFHLVDKNGQGKLQPLFIDAKPLDVQISDEEWSELRNKVR